MGFTTIVTYFEMSDHSRYLINALCWQISGQPKIPLLIKILSALFESFLAIMSCTNLFFILGFVLNMASFLCQWVQQIGFFKYKKNIINKLQLKLLYQVSPHSHAS